MLPRMRVAPTVLALVVLPLVAAAPARAAPPPASEAPPPAREAPRPAREAPPHAREAPPPGNAEPHARGGLVLGLGGGFAMGTASGYPNDLQKIDDPRYFSAGGFMAGGSSGGFVMGAFAPELNFGVWVAQGATVSASGRWRSRGYGGGFRIEVFPAGWLVPALRDLGVMGQFGVGAGELRPTDPAAAATYAGADGVQSYVGVGVFHEWVFAHPGKTRWVLGPSVEYQLVASRPFERSTLMLGLRIAFYSGPGPGRTKREK